jgi:predicted alpha/beta-hydrolase family hydrolase
VNVLFDAAAEPFACCVLAHGAGAGMKHPFMAAVASGLAARGVSTLRYEFPYMERGSKRPDTPAVAQARVREAVAEAAKRAPVLPLFAGGKSFGGRMTSQAESAEPLAGVHGLVFFGFPLHAPGKPSIERAAHLDAIRVPMLFLQGSRDEFAQLDLLEPLVAKLAPRATLELFTEADHSFHVPARTGRKDADVREELLEKAARWMRANA